MKTMKVITPASISLLLSLVSCSSSMEELISMNTGSEVSASVSRYPFGDAMTRVELSEGTNGVEFHWSAGDEIAVIGYVLDEYETDKTYQMTNHTLTSFASDRLWANFDGGAFTLSASATYFSFYPYSATDAVIGTNQCERYMHFTNQTQTGNNSLSHLGAYNYMVADEVKTDAEGACRFQFSNSCSPVRLTLTLPESAAGKTVTKLTLTRYQNADHKFVKKALQKMHKMSSGIEYQVSENDISQTLSLTDCTIGEEHTLVAWEMFYPVDHTTGTLPARYYITVSCSDGSVYAGQAAGKKMEGGKAYRINASLSSSATLCEVEWGICNDGATQPFDAGTIYNSYPEELADYLPTPAEAEALANKENYDVLLGSGYDSNGEKQFGVYIREKSADNSHTPIFLPVTTPAEGGGYGRYLLRGGTKYLYFDANAQTLSIEDLTTPLPAAARRLKK